MEMAESTTKKDGERRSDGEERHSSLVALSTRAPPSSASAPKTPTLAASLLHPRGLSTRGRVARGAIIRKRENTLEVVTDYGIN